MSFRQHSTPPWYTFWFITFLIWFTFEFELTFWFITFLIWYTFEFELTFEFECTVQVLDLSWILGEKIMGKNWIGPKWPVCPKLCLDVARKAINAYYLSEPPWGGRWGRRRLEYFDWCTFSLINSRLVRVYNVDSFRRYPSWVHNFNLSFISNAMFCLVVCRAVSFFKETKDTEGTISWLLAPYLLQTFLSTIETHVCV